MKFKIPFLTTRIETDLMLVFVLAPLWWVTGFSIFAYYAAVFFVFSKFMLQCIHEYKPMRFSAASNLFALFLISYLISIIINIPIRPPQRLFSSFNNWLMFFMGYLVLVLVCNCNPPVFFKKLIRTCCFFCAVTGGIGVCVLLLWLKGIKIDMPNLLGKALPSLSSFPYFYGQLSIQGTVSEWLMGEDTLPRLTPYSLSPTGTGGLMLMVLPPALLYFTGKNKNVFLNGIVLVLGLTVLLFSLSRAAIYGFVLAVILVFAIRRGFSFIFSLGCVLAGLIVSGLFSRGVEWVFNLRKSSSVGRLQLFEEGLRLVMEENPLMGIGVRLREGYTMMAIGTHGGMYLEIIFTTGIVGLTFFLLFHGFILGNWFTARRVLDHPMKRKLWSYIGVSLLAVHIWVLTDSLVAYPLIAYCYFLIVGAALLLRKSGRPEEWDEYF